MADNNIKKNKQGYGYKYTDLAQIHEYLETINATYWQYIEPIDGIDYIYTVPTIDGVEKPARRGCRVVQAALQGKSNEAQEQGSGLTYARRYSLLMAFGLATEDDDAKKMEKKTSKGITSEQINKIALELARTGIPEKTICESYKHSTISEFTKEEAESCLNRLAKSKDR